METIGIEAFDGFDFSRQPASNALDEVLQEMVGKALQGTESDTPGGRLALLPVQTGLGKTHSCLTLLIEQMLSEIQRVREQPHTALRPLIYITDSIDNVRNAYEKLLLIIDTQDVDGQLRFTPKQAEYLKQRVLYLKSQKDQLEGSSDDVIRGLIGAFAPTDQKLLQKWDEYQRLCATVRNNRDVASVMASRQSELAQEVYGAVLRPIQETLRERAAKELELIRDVEAPLLRSFLPADALRTGEAHVLFMTTAKYLHGCDHAMGKYRPLLDLAGQLLFIDEVDRQSNEMLKQLIDGRVVDLIEVIRTLLPLLRENHLDRGPQYQDIADVFGRLVIDLEEFSASWKAASAFDVPDIEDLKSPINLFSDRSYTHVHSEGDKYNFVAHDDLRQKNLILVESKNSDLPPGSRSLSEFLYGADLLFQRFVHAMELAVFKKQNIARRGGHTQSRARYLDSQRLQIIVSILRHYGIPSLIDVVNEAQKYHGASPRHRADARKQRNYHARGFKLIEVRRHTNSQDTVAGNYRNLRCSPTGWLAEMIEGGAIVVGVSATAEAQTVVHNFDLHYLEQRLGNAFSRPDHHQRRRLEAYYQRRRNYAGLVKIEPSFHGANQNWLEEQLTQWRGYRNPAAELNTWFVGNDYERNQFSKMLHSLKAFAESPDNRYMLVLRNTFKNLSNADLREFVEACLQRWSPERVVNTFYDVNAANLRIDIYGQILAVLENSNDKVIVFSSYSSMGTGKNPDYAVGTSEDRKSLVWVGEGMAHTARTDIDALYLEKPTNVFPGDDKPETQVMIRLHSTLALQERDELSLGQIRHLIRLVLRHDNHEVARRYYQTQDYLAAVFRLIEQAVGRTARTAYKRTTLLLMADAELAKILVKDDRDSRLLSHEYLALRNQAGVTDSTFHANQHQRRLKNLALRHSENSRQYLDQLVRNLWRGNEDTSLGWEALRTRVLQAPGLDAEPRSEAFLYLRPPEAAQSYAYSGDFEHNTFGLEFFAGLSRARQVGPEACSLPTLMLNAVVRNHFVENGFACTWPTSQWLLTPVVFQRIYCAAVGEQAVRAILEARGCVWKPLPEGLYEKFDGLVEYRGQRVVIDVKHWQRVWDQSRQDAEVMRVKRERVWKELGAGTKVVYLQVMGDASSQVNFLDTERLACAPEDACIMDWPGLVDQNDGQVLSASLAEFFTWLEIPT